jgi:hypothetical protein
MILQEFLRSVQVIVLVLNIAILCTFYTVQYFDNVGSALVIYGRISLRLSQEHLLMPKYAYPLRAPLWDPLKQNFYLWMDLNYFFFGQNHQKQDFFIL